MRWFLVVLVVAACGGSKPEHTPPPVPADAAATAREDLKSFMQRAQACKVDADCVHLGDFCDCGCGVTVNKTFADDAQKRLLENGTECAIDCPPVNEPVCDQGVCNSPDR